MHCERKFRDGLQFGDLLKKTHVLKKYQKANN